MGNRSSPRRYKRGTWSSSTSPTRSPRAPAARAGVGASPNPIERPDPAGPRTWTMNPTFQQLLQMSQQVQSRLSQLQTELGQKTVTCSSGGGMVTATADGRGKIRAIKIEPAVANGGDVEMLEDLVLAAVSEAQNRAQQVYEDEMKKVSG